MIEAQRIDHQRRIEGGRGAQDRNRAGQSATPFPLAVEIIRLVGSLWPAGEPVEFLEPCVGTGSFYSATRGVLTDVRRAVGIEKDAKFAASARDLWADAGLEVITDDFTRREPPARRFNLLVTNPPYVRHHHLTAGEKTRLRRDVQLKTGIRLSGLSGLYCYFLLLADDWLVDGGLSVWLIPGEFLDVNYGSGVKEYLTTRVNLLQIHRFGAVDVRFDDALVTSSVVIFRRERPGGRAVKFTQGGKLTSPESVVEVGPAELSPGLKWGRLFSGEAAKAKSRLKFGDLFQIKRGIATGGNAFFIVTESRAKELGIPGQFQRPILPSPRSLPGDVIEGRRDGMPDFPDPNVLIDCRLGPEQVREQFPTLWAYYEEGRGAGIHEGYLTSRRTPWYAQEDRPAAPFLCTYMGRAKADGGGPFRFIRNRSKATAPNVYLMLYPKGPLKAALSRKPTLEAKVLDALRGLDALTMTDGGRVYGGGLHKVEPNELANLPADFLISALDGEMQGEALLFA